jgi:predicted enzyme related to lactoylglutathione lyase
MKLRNVIFYVRDIEIAKEFYQNLGMEIGQDFGDFVSFSLDQGDVWFSIMESDTEEKEPGKQICTLSVENIDEYYKKIVEQEIKVVTELFEAPYGKTFEIKDIDGNQIEFMEE